MNVRGMTSYLYLLVLLVATGCTKLSPELGFGFLKSSDDSLTIESNLQTINSSEANSTVLLKGLCEANTNLTLIGPNNMEFKCENLSYSKELRANLFNEGENIISIEALDNSQNKIAEKKIRIVKDTVAPSVTINGAASIPSSDIQVILNGACSENSLPVMIEDIINSKSASATCTNGVWTYTAPIPSGFSGTSLKYKTKHSDSAGNATTTSELIVTRIITPSFTISGVKNLPSEVASNLLRRTFGNLIVEWSAGVNAFSYDVYIERNYLTTPSSVCYQTGLSTLNATFSLSSACLLSVGENLRAKVLGWDSAHSTHTTEYFTFIVKSAPALRADAELIYINSDPDVAVPTTSISYSNLISDPNAVGPFTMIVTDYGSLTGMISPDPGSQVLSITPTTAVSGIFPVKIRISDENSVSSGDITLKIAVVYPYSWSGLVSNDFSVKGNWCGVAGLKTGCSGIATPPSSTTRVFIDNLCEKPTPETIIVRCNPSLSADSTVRSLFLKYGALYQADHAFTVGSLNDSGSYFKMSSGAFNDGSMGGVLTVYRGFTVEAGVFNAPKNSDLILNTNTASNGSDAFKVANTYNYFHNGSTLILQDPNGKALSQNLNVPAGFGLSNLTINSNGGYWGIKSTSLYISGDLNLIGTKDSSNNMPMLNATVASAKIILTGNINCTGTFAGGNLPVHVLGTASKYKTTYAGCKMPQIKVSDTSALVSESSYSTEDTTVQSLGVSAGNFIAPSPFRKLIFKSSGLDDGTVVADLNNGGFNHNNGTVVFQTDSSSSNYIIKLPTMYDLIFTNPLNLTSFYEVHSSFSSNSVYLKGSNKVPVRGSSRAITAQQLTFDTGFVADANQLTRLSQYSSSSSYVYVNTSEVIGIPQLELKNAYGFLGTSNLFNFSGTTFVLPTNDVYILLLQTLKYYAKTGSYSITGTGAISSGQ